MTNSNEVPPRRSHRLTRLGFHFLFVGTFAMLGGALRGFNLLLVLAGLLVGALIMQWRWSRRSVSSLSADRRLPTEAFAGRPFRVRFRIQNSSHVLPAWMIRVEDTIEGGSMAERKRAVCGVGVVPAGKTVLADYDAVVTQRGRYRFGPSFVASSFPFTLMTTRQTIDSGADLFVYPRLYRLRPRWTRFLLTRTGGVTATARRSGHTEGDFFGLREWQMGDNPKWIHWRTSARLGEPAVRQFEQQRRFDACILVDGHLPEGSTSEDNDTERTISLAATLMMHLVGSPSNRLILAVAASSNSAVVGGGSREGKRRMLASLAELEPTPHPELSAAAGKAIEMVGYAQDLIVLSPRSTEEAQRSDESLARAISPWARRGCLRWIQVDENEMKRWVAREQPADSAPSQAAGEVATVPSGPRGIDRA